MLFANPFKDRLPTPTEALPGRDMPIIGPLNHAVLGTPIMPPFPEGVADIQLGLGCFWGAERLFWQMDGVYSTAVGYAGGLTPHPTYEEVCSGRTGHTEIVRVVYNPEKCSLESLLAVFWQAHDPTQGNRQGNDRGTQYRSAIYVNTDDELALARETARHYGASLAKGGFGPVTTEIGKNKTFYYAEEFHQQYLHKVPNGYCGLSGCGISYPAQESLTDRD